MSRLRLCINIDHVATLRNARGGDEPDPVRAALAAERSGADGIVCHLREDRRHIRDADVRRLRESVSTKLDLEMAAVPEIIRIALNVIPDLVTLVPERRKELTTEGGLDVARNSTALKRTINRFHERGILVSLFVDPARKQIDASVRVGADLVEIHTGAYAEALQARSRRQHLLRIREIASYARRAGLAVNAGHGLDYANIRAISAIGDIEEVSIGHAVIVRAVEVGMAKAVREMKALVRGR